MQKSVKNNYLGGPKIFCKFYIAVKDFEKKLTFIFAS